jgi:hypothetical protein
MQRLVKSDRFENRLWPAARGQPGGQIGETDKLIARICGELEQCRRLVAIPGIGPITATATVQPSATVQLSKQKLIDSIKENNRQNHRKGRLSPRSEACNRVCNRLGGSDL